MDAPGGGGGPHGWRRRYFGDRDPIGRRICVSLSPAGLARDRRAWSATVRQTAMDRAPARARVPAARAERPLAAPT